MEMELQSSRRGEVKQCPSCIQLILSSSLRLYSTKVVSIFNQGFAAVCDLCFHSLFSPLNAFLQHANICIYIFRWCFFQKSVLMEGESKVELPTRRNLPFSFLSLPYYRLQLYAITCWVFLGFLQLHMEFIEQT